MKQELLEILRCPGSGQRLELVEGLYVDGVVDSGWLSSPSGSYRYPIRNGIPRFVPESNYADSFGMQWNKFRSTQLDSHSGCSISAERFWESTGWQPEDLAGHWVLDAGCGSGRFAEVALEAGARVLALDYSSAVDACYANLRQHANLHVVQGDIYALPLQEAVFKFVYSLGVLQHTPNVEKAFLSLPHMVADGGWLCVDYYARTWKSVFLPKYWLRPLARHVSTPRLFSIVERWVPRLLPVAVALGRTPAIGRALKRIIPVVSYVDELPLSDQQQLEWSVLDTFDMFSPAYDHPQTAMTVRAWFERAGLEDISVFKAGHLVGRGRKPQPTSD